MSPNARFVFRSFIDFDQFYTDFCSYMYLSIHIAYFDEIP